MVSTTTTESAATTTSTTTKPDNVDLKSPDANAVGTKIESEVQPVRDDQRVSLAILSDITTAQSTHGLKHSDYDRYRTYCTRRLSRIRTATNLSNKHASHPHRYQQRNVSVKDIITDSRALQIPLVQSERDWSFAMSLKNQQQRKNSNQQQKKPFSIAKNKRAIFSHLEKAVVHATTLSTLSNLTADEQTILEAQAYYQIIKATLSLERETWNVALSSFEIAHKIYTGMAGVRTGTSSATVYERKLEEISQAIRFCKYNIARSPNHSKQQNTDTEEGNLLNELKLEGASQGISGTLGGKIEAALAEARKRAAQSFGHVSWCNVQVPLRSERVREAVLIAEQECQSFDSSSNNSSSSNLNGNVLPSSSSPKKERSADDYDKLFVVLNDAIKTVADELKDFQKSAGASDSRVEELQLIVAYLTYSRLSRTIDRNLILVSSLRQSKKMGSGKPDDFVRMYDNLISNVSDMSSLKGVEADAAMTAELTARKRLFQAFRCFYLAQCYQAAELPAEAAALFDRVGIHAKSVPLGSKYAAEAKRVVEESSGMKWRARAQAYLDETVLANGMNGLKVDNNEDNDTFRNDGESNDQHSFVGESTYTMLDHLDKFTSFVDVGGDSVASNVTKKRAVAVCNLPPPLEAVPCKPVLFDLAIDGIRILDDEEEEEEEIVDVEEVEEQSGKEDDTKDDSEGGTDNTSETTSRPTSMFAGTRLGRWWSGSGS